MVSFAEIEEELMKNIPIEENSLKSSLALIRESVEKLWADDAPRIVKDYTDHGIKHCERMTSLAKLLLNANNGKPLSAHETYLLLAGIYLHDIGMQCDVAQFPYIVIKAESLGADFGSEFAARYANEYSNQEQKAIRNNHHILTAAWIDYAFRSGETLIGPAAKKIPNYLISDLIDVCMHHSKLPITNCPTFFRSDQAERKLLIASILRFSDELDIDRNRVSIETVKNFRLDPQNAVYWWIHNYTTITFSPSNVIILSIRLHPEDRKKYGSYIYDKFIIEFQIKNQPIISILRQNGIDIAFSGESQIIEDDYAEHLPQCIVQALLSMLEKPDPLINLAEEVRIWMQAIRYEVGEIIRIDERAVEIFAASEQNNFRNRVFIRCIDGEITRSDVAELENKLTVKIPRGWIISYKRVSPNARERALEEDNVQVFNLSEFLRQIWRPYIDALEILVEKSNIITHYVDLECHKEEINEKNDVIKDKYESLDEYIDNWLREPGKMHISLLGDFGSGKTWFCRHYAYRQLERYLKDPVNERLPLLITLRSFAKSMTSQQLINDALLEQYKLQFVGSAYDIFQEINRRGKLLLILDGFDEMARQVDYQTVVDNFWELANLVDNNSKVLLTSRTEYFHWAKESEKILSGKEFGRRTIVLSPPKFEVLYLNQFNDDQIREVIKRRKGSKGLAIAEQILHKPNLAGLARKPVLVELLLASLDEIREDFLGNSAQVYLYATNKLILRNITSERTFTTTSSKLYFLCELAWEMIESEKLRIHFTEIPNRIKLYFEDKIKDQHELDTWDFDLRSQTLLHRDAAGYYEFAHKSLAEYFTAFKFLCEMGCLQLLYKNTYCEANGGPCELPYKEKEIVALAESFGKMSLSDPRMSAIRSFLFEMINADSTTRLKEIISKTKKIPFESAKYVGGNAASFLNDLGCSLKNEDLSYTILAGANLFRMDLEGCNFRNACLREANLIGSNLSMACLFGADLTNSSINLCNFLNSDLRECNLQHLSSVDAIDNLDYRNYLNHAYASMDDPIVLGLAWSQDGEYLSASSDDGTLRVWGVKNWSPFGKIFWHQYLGKNLAFRSENTLTLFSAQQLIVRRRDEYNIYEDHASIKFDEFPNKEISIDSKETMINRLYLSPSCKYISTSHGKSGRIKIWDAFTGQEIASLEAQPGWCNAALFLFDENQIISTGYYGDINIWDWSTKNLKSKFWIPNATNAFELRLSKNQNKIAALAPAENDKIKAYVWSFPEFEPLFEREVYESHCLDLSPDGTMIAVSVEKNINHKESELYVINFSNDNSDEASILELKFSYIIADIKFCPDGSKLAICGKDIQIFDIDPSSENFGECIQTLIVRTICKDMKIGGAIGLGQTLMNNSDDNRNLLNFFLDRGATLNDETTITLSEAEYDRQI